MTQGKISWADLSEEENELGEVDEARILNRIVRITEKAGSMRQTSDMRTCWCRAWEWKEPTQQKLLRRTKERTTQEMLEELNTKEAREFRGLAARANYLAQDRPDIQYAAKEACRGHGQPHCGCM